MYLIFVAILLTTTIINVNGKTLIEKTIPFKDLFEDWNDDVPNKHAIVARQVVHKSEWASVGTISTINEIKGFPMVNVISIADSPRGWKSTGQIYYFLTNLDFTAKDLLKQNKMTVMFSNDQDLSCSKNGIDPLEPTCPRIMISGSTYQLDKSSEEYKFANKSVFSHHPAAANWIKHHEFFLCKLNISQVIVLDNYGGANFVTPSEYFNVVLDNDFANDMLVSESQANNNGAELIDIDNSHFLNSINNDVSDNFVAPHSMHDRNNKIKIKIDKQRNVVNIEV